MSMNIPRTIDELPMLIELQIIYDYLVLKTFVYKRIVKHNRCVSRRRSENIIIINPPIDQTQTVFPNSHFGTFPIYRPVYKLEQIFDKTTKFV